MRYYSDAEFNGNGSRLIGTALVGQDCAMMEGA